MKKAVRLIFVMILAFFYFPIHSYAASSNWIGPGSDFNSTGNWNAGVPANGEAIFNSAVPTDINLSASVTVTTFTFNSGATAYTFTVQNGTSLTYESTTGGSGSGLNPSGLYNNSTNKQTLNISSGGTVSFTGNSTAGNAIINNEGTLTFNAVPGFLSVPLGGTAANATIINRGLLDFDGVSSAANAYIINFSTIQLTTLSIGSPTLANARVDNNGFIDASTANSPWSVGSIDGSGKLLLGSETLTIGSNNLNTSINGDISGTGASLIKIGTGTLTLSGTNTYSGHTIISQGELRVNGSLTSDIDVQNGTTFSGIGTVGTVVSTGTVSPGTTTPGRMNVASYSSQGVLNILVNGNSVSSLNVLGGANILGSTLTISGTNLAVGRYQILTSARLTGTFEDVISPSSLFLVMPLYTSTDILLQIGFATPFLSLAQTSNQRNLASNIQEAKITTTSQYSSAIMALAELPNAEIPHAYDQMSGDALSTFQETNFQNASVFATGISQRSVQISSGSYGLWVQAMGWTEAMDGSTPLGSPSAQATTSGFEGGYDFEVIEGMVVGLSGGYGKTNLDVADRSSSGNTTSIHSGLYAGYEQEGWFTSGIAAWTSGSNQMTRTIHYGSINNEAASQFTSRLFSASMQTGYSFHQEKPLQIEPSLALRYAQLEQAAFTESGGQGLDLNVSDRIVPSWNSSVGTRLKYFFGRGGINRGFGTLSVAWDHEWSQTQNAISVRFADVTGGSNYTVEGTPRDRNAAAIGLHGEMPITGPLSLIADYTAHLASTHTSQWLFGGLRWKW